MSFIRILLVGAAILPLLQAQSPLTLDPSMIEEAKRAAFRQSGVLMPEPETSAVQGDSARWQAAMDAAATVIQRLRGFVSSWFKYKIPSKPRDNNPQKMAKITLSHMIPMLAKSI